MGHLTPPHSPLQGGPHRWGNFFPPSKMTLTSKGSTFFWANGGPHWWVIAAVQMMARCPIIGKNFIWVLLCLIFLTRWFGPRGLKRSLHRNSGFGILFRSWMTQVRFFDKIPCPEYFFCLKYAFCISQSMTPRGVLDSEGGWYFEGSNFFRLVTTPPSYAPQFGLKGCGSIVGLCTSCTSSASF